MRVNHKRYLRSGYCYADEFSCVSDNIWNDSDGGKVWWRSAGSEKMKNEEWPMTRLNREYASDHLVTELCNMTLIYFKVAWKWICIDVWDILRANYIRLIKTEIILSFAPTSRTLAQRAQSSQFTYSSTKGRISRLFPWPFSSHLYYNLK